MFGSFGKIKSKNDSCKKELTENKHKSMKGVKVTKFIMGPSSRSTTGCLCCRKRRYV